MKKDVDIGLLGKSADYNYFHLLFVIIANFKI